MSAAIRIPIVPAGGRLRIAGFRVPARLEAPLRALFGTPLNAILTVLFVGFALWTVPAFLRWAIFDAIVFPAVPESCAGRDGACWSFVVAKSGQILFGIYPPDEHWRPAAVCVIVLGLLGVSVRPASWTKWLAMVWIAAMTVVLWLMGGGFGLVEVPTSSWGGLPVTLILAVFALGIAFPLSIFLALGRRSEMPIVRAVCVLTIETIRGLPLLSLLFVASIMLPLFLPPALLPDKLVRALVALTIFAAAYLAEVVRGGLQAVPKGQIEGATALGIGYWRTQFLVVLPQALRIAIPALANTIIVMVKNTSLVLVVGIFDLISSGKAALSDPAWPSPSAETYLFIGFLYFALAFAFARFADYLERRGRHA
jgi:general L-amino acid transport system permease protein